MLVSPTFEKNGLTASYTMVSEVISSIGDVNKSISIDNMKIVKNNDPMMRLLKGIVRTGKGLNTIRMTSNMMNGIYVQDALIYRNT